MNRLILTLCVLAFTGCAWIGAHQSQLTATAAVVGKRVAAIAASVVLSAAVDQFDASKKQDFLDGLASGFRSYEGMWVTSDDIKAIALAWTPDKSHWNEAAERFAAEWARANPRTSQEAAVFLEAYARSLNGLRVQ